MLDLERIENNPDEFRRMLASRYVDSNEVNALLQKNTLRRKLAADSAAKKKLRNQMSQDAAEAKRGGASGEALAVMMNEMRALGSEIAVIDVDIAELDDKIDAFMRSAPNYPHTSVPAGRNEKSNEEAYHWGARPAFAWEPKPYWNIGSDLRILDFDNTAKMKGTQFTVYRDLGAQLERATVNFFLDTLIRAGYREVAIPYLVINDGNTETHQLPILDEASEQADAYGILPPDTSIAGLYRNMVLDEAELPVSHCAFSASYRPGAACARYDTGGLTGQQQLNQVEMAKLCMPGRSYDELSAMSENVQAVLQQLKLPYRVMLACTGALAYSAAKTFHLEVWMPGYGRYIGVSQCSNCEDYVARGMNIRYRETESGELRLCHTLSGSGVAIGRMVAAILENHQNEDGSVTVPEALRPYMHTDIIR